VLNVNFLQYRGSVVSYGNVAETVHEHFVLAPGTKGGANGFCDSHSRHDVVVLGIATTLALRTLF
jgi:hypothetical protein